MASKDNKQEVLLQILRNPQAEPKQLPLRLLEDITEAFSDKNIIGQGTFGVVYKGSLQDGSKVAIKKLILPAFQSSTKFIDNFEKGFNDEVDCLKKVKHKYIVRFLGYCAESREVVITQHNGKEISGEQLERLLCFEYVPNGNLQDKFHGLEWQMRYEIIMGVCMGLDYLHTECSMFHLDLKPDNILLNENMEPKITDFGLSRLFSDQSKISTIRSAGTPGYMAPELHWGKITRKADVYSLGVIITVLLTGSNEEPPSIEMVHKKWRRNLLVLGQREYGLFKQAYNQISTCTEIALTSVQDKPEDRPTISEILQILMTNRSFQTTIVTDVPALEKMDLHGTMFNDDEEPIPPASQAGRPALGFSDAGRASVKAYHAKEVPLEVTKISVQLEVSTSSTTVGRAPVDLVVVLDVSGSMCDDGGPSLDQFKSAVEFVVAKLQPMDRLSIVTFSNVGNRVCPLRNLSQEGKLHTMWVIDGLTASSGGANIKAGLETGLAVLACRRHNAGRVANILLLSDGHQEHGDARQVSNPCNVPIQTVASGAHANMHLLSDLAKNNTGMAFNLVRDDSDAWDMKTLHNVVFSQLMASLLQVAVLDLYLILAKPNTPDNDLGMIAKVATNNLRKETDWHTGAITIKLGDILYGEVRKVLVDLILVEAEGDSDYEADILDISISYPNSQGIRHKYRGQTLHVTRSAAIPATVQGLQTL